MVTGEVSPSLDIGRFSLSSGSIDDILEAVSVLEEIVETDFVFLGTINGLNEFDILFRDWVAKKSEGLSELLSRHLEVLMAVPVLEEALGIEAIFPDNFRETFQDSLNFELIVFSGSWATIDCVSAGCAELLVQILLKVLNGENFVNFVDEVVMTDVITGL